MTRSAYGVPKLKDEDNRPPPHPSLHLESEGVVPGVTSTRCPARFALRTRRNYWKLLMAPQRRLRVSQASSPVPRVTRDAIHGAELVYVMRANEKVQYTQGRSRIVYIGRTGQGMSRIATSAVQRADRILGMRGITEFTVVTLTCPRVRGVESWKKLERALLFASVDNMGLSRFVTIMGAGCVGQTS